MCLATSGPGATNLVTGIATANYDSVPLVCFTGQVPTNLIGNDAFQEVDIAGVVMPITKYSFIVKNVHELADTIRRAFKIAKSGRPGPVLVDITKDVTANMADYEPMQPEEIKRVTDTIDDKAVETAAALINRAKKPFIMAGGGAVIADAEQELRTFADKIDAAVCDTLMGKGAIEGTAERYTGMIGMHGTKASNFGLADADLLIVVGARFSDRVIGNASKFAENAKIIHIDVDQAEINKNIEVDASIIGDAKVVLQKLIDQVEESKKPEWMAEIQELKQKYPMTYEKGILTGPAIIEKLYELTNGDATVVTEVGQHQMWAAQFYQFKKPHQLLTSGGLGTMGYGLGAALGAKVARPDETVVNIAGDGCFRMNMNEIATAARYNIPVIEIVINNHVLGMVRQWQTLFYDKRYSNTILNDNVDFAKVAEALGAIGCRVTTIEEFEEAFKKAQTAGRPVVIDCIINEDDTVWPMVAPGKPIETCFSGEDLEK